MERSSLSVPDTPIYETAKKVGSVFQNPRSQFFKQRTAIASGIASSKPVILFDEPTSGLDLAHMKQVALQIETLRDMGKTIFIVTHDLEFILSCCDHIIRLENGRLAQNHHLNEPT